MPLRERPAASFNDLKPSQLLHVLTHADPRSVLHLRLLNRQVAQCANHDVPCAFLERFVSLCRECVASQPTPDRDTFACVPGQLGFVLDTARVPPSFVRSFAKIDAVLAAFVAEAHRCASDFDDPSPLETIDPSSLVFAAATPRTAPDSVAPEVPSVAAWPIWLGHTGNLLRGLHRRATADLLAFESTAEERRGAVTTEFLDLLLEPVPFVVAGSPDGCATAPTEEAESSSVVQPTIAARCRREQRLPLGAYDPRALIAFSTALELALPAAAPPHFTAAGKVGSRGQQLLKVDGGVDAASCPQWADLRTPMAGVPDDVRRALFWRVQPASASQVQAAFGQRPASGASAASLPSSGDHACTLLRDTLFLVVDPSRCSPGDGGDAVELTHPQRGVVELALPLTAHAIVDPTESDGQFARLRFHLVDAQLQTGGLPDRRATFEVMLPGQRESRRPTSSVDDESAADELIDRFAIDAPRRAHGGAGAGAPVLGNLMRLSTAVFHALQKHDRSIQPDRAGVDDGQRSNPPLLTPDQQAALLRASSNPGGGQPSSAASLQSAIPFFHGPLRRRKISSSSSIADTVALRAFAALRGVGTSPVFNAAAANGAVNIDEVVLPSVASVRAVVPARQQIADDVPLQGAVDNIVLTPTSIGFPQNLAVIHFAAEPRGDWRETHRGFPSQLGDALLARARAKGIEAVPEFIGYTTVAPLAIEDALLRGMKHLAQITCAAPSPIRHIGSSFAASCTSLTTIDLSGMTSLEQLPPCFAIGCTALRRVVLPPSVRGIGDAFLNSCGAMEELDLSQLSNLNAVGSDFLSQLSSLRSVRWPTVTAKHGVPLGKSALGGSITRHAGADFELPVIALRMTSLPDRFAYGSGLVRVSLKDACNLRKLSNASFGSCDFLTAVDLPSTIQEIGPSCFARCRSLRALELHELSSLARPSASGDMLEYFAADCLQLELVTLPWGHRRDRPPPFGLPRNFCKGCGALRHLRWGTAPDESIHVDASALTGGDAAATAVVTVEVEALGRLDRASAETALSGTPLLAVLALEEHH